jgi:hypothetical protein
MKEATTMSITAASDRSRAVHPIRAALQQAMVSPRVQQAVAVFVNALLDEGEAILRQRYPGETVTLYNRKRAGQDEQEQRNRRIQAMAAAPSWMSPAQIAAREGISARRVQQVLRSAASGAANGQPGL